MLSTSIKLRKLRSLMSDCKIDAYLIPHSDEFQNEFLPLHNRRLEWMSNFSGSAGDIVVTLKKAFLFVDGRYTIQASKEVDKNYTIVNYKDALPHQIIKKQKTNNIGYDGNIINYGRLKYLSKNLKNHNLINIKDNLVDQIWINRPKKKRTKPFFLKKKQTGKDAKSKVQKVLFYLTKMKSDRYLITATDSICWLLNIRASDIQYSPLFLSRAIIENNGQVHIFSDFNSKQRIIDRQRINFHPAHHIQNYIKSCSKNNKFLVDRNTIPANFVGLIKTTSKIQLIDDVIQNFKSIRNKSEIKGLRDCHIRDGAALTKSIYWLKKNIDKKKITELDASNLIDRNRKKSKYFHSLSFPTISGTGPNAAIVHYRVTKKTNRLIRKSDILLIDSGAQYLDGTTDITRSIAFTPQNKERKEMYTRVLKGHIAVATCNLKYGEKGKRIDNLARKFLREINTDYEHGTGHGVGHFLNVHEGPQSISKYSKNRFENGMLTSNEPGYYKKGQFGIRIENLILSKIKKNILSFETVSFAPLEKNLIENAMLNEAEIYWIYNYHKKVRKKLYSFMNEAEKKWLLKETDPL